MRITFDMYIKMALFVAPISFLLLVMMKANLFVILIVPLIAPYVVLKMMVGETALKKDAVHVDDLPSSERARLKREGVEDGVYDVFLVSKLDGTPDYRYNSRSVFVKGLSKDNIDH